MRCRHLTSLAGAGDAIAGVILSLRGVRQRDAVAHCSCVTSREPIAVCKKNLRLWQEAAVHRKRVLRQRRSRSRPRKLTHLPSF